MVRERKVDRLLWSIALPGFGQFLNRSYFKGVILIALEFVINVQAHLNTIIQLSFLGDIHGAVEQTNYQWLMFYPCLYMFGMWDAFREAGGGRSPYAALLFVIPAYTATVGVIYSGSLKIGGILLGPVWLPMLFCFLGLGTAFLIRAFLPARPSGPEAEPEEHQAI